MLPATIIADEGYAVEWAEAAGIATISKGGHALGHVRGAHGRQLVALVASAESGPVRAGILKGWLLYQAQIEALER